MSCRACRSLHHRRECQRTTSSLFQSSFLFNGEIPLVFSTCVDNSDQGESLVTPLHAIVSSTCTLPSPTLAILFRVVDLGALFRVWCWCGDFCLYFFFLNLMIVAKKKGERVAHLKILFSICHRFGNCLWFSLFQIWELGRSNFFRFLTRKCLTPI